MSEIEPPLSLSRICMTLIGYQSIKSYSLEYLENILVEQWLENGAVVGGTVMNGSTRNSTLLLDIAESDADVRRRYTCAVIFDYFVYGLCHLESAVPIQQNQAVEGLGSALDAFLYQTAR